MSLHDKKEAKLTDIPVPLHTKPLSVFFDESFSDSGTILGYSCTLKKSEIVAFYRQEMERLGWRGTCCYEGIESLLCFEKPTRFCMVSFRPYKRKNVQIVIVTGDKQLIS